MTSRRAVLLLPLLAGPLAGCAPAVGPGAATSPGGPREAPEASLEDPPRRAGRPLILVAMPDSPSFRTVRAALVKEVERAFDIVTRPVDARTTVAELAADIARTRPNGVVLMDNPTVKLYRDYQRQRPAAPMPPALVVMASFLDELRAQLRNVTGVAYELPGVTAFVNLRSIIARPVAKVGVLHRPVFGAFVERQRALAAKEQIELVAAQVRADPEPRDVRRALQQLGSAGVDTLWVLNDNGLLRDTTFLESAWRQELPSLRVPVIVGVPALVSGEAKFGNFAVLPDLAGLGLQAANLLFELADAGWKADDLPIEIPISTVTVVNLEQLTQTWGVRRGAAQRIDRIVR